MSDYELEIVRAVDAYKAAVRRNAAEVCSECGHQRDSLNVERAGLELLRAYRVQALSEIGTTWVSMSP